MSKEKLDHELDTFFELTEQRLCQNLRSSTWRWSTCLRYFMKLKRNDHSSEWRNSERDWRRLEGDLSFEQKVIKRFWISAVKDLLILQSNVLKLGDLLQTPWDLSVVSITVLTMFSMSKSDTGRGAHVKVATIVDLKVFQNLTDAEDLHFPFFETGRPSWSATEWTVERSRASSDISVAPLVSSFWTT